MADLLKKVLAPLRRYALWDHTHDDRYYTEAEVAALLNQQSVSAGSIGATSPAWTNAIAIPTYSYTTETWWTPYVYKVNVPGYFYISVKRYRVDVDVQPFLGPSFTALNLLPTEYATYASKCMIWHAVSRQDDYADGSFLWPLLVPGTSTYVRFYIGSTTDGGTDAADPTIYFIPCKAISGKVANANCITWTATSNGIDDNRVANDRILGAHPTTAASAIFKGDWRDNFPNLNL